MEIKADLGGALRKTAILAKTPKAALKCLQRWGANSVTALKRRAAGMGKSGKHPKTGQLARAIGMRMDASNRVLSVGSNVQKPTDVKYARILDEGGTIRPKGHPYLAIPLKGVKDRPKDHPNAFLIETRKGNVLLVEEVYRQNKKHFYRDEKGRYAGLRGFAGAGGGTFERAGIRALFLLKEEVTISPTRWFSGTMRMQEALLPGYMDEKVIFDEAAKMAGVGGEA